MCLFNEYLLKKTFLQIEHLAGVYRMLGFPATGEETSITQLQSFGDLVLLLLIKIHIL